MHCPSCQAENDDAADNCIVCGKGIHALTRGSVLSGRYEILDAIGRGGMGVVYKARDIDLDETVAIKVIRTDGTMKSTDGARRFRSEIKLARRVTHTNVCRIHDYHQEGHLTYIVMEYVPGTDLKHVLRQHGRLSAVEALEVVLQVAHGLEAVHRQGVVHRDLKTPNIMRTPDGAVKLMDFGIAKSLAGDMTTGVTGTGQIVGTPEYMSPEQARGNPVDVRSDIYALGVVLFELLTGELPFRGDTPVSTILKLLHEPPPLDGALKAYIPEPVVPILRKALTKEPRERYASASELIAELGRAVSSMTGTGGLPATEAKSVPTAILAHAPATPRAPARPPPLAATSKMGEARAPLASGSAGAAAPVAQRAWRTHWRPWGIALALAMASGGFFALHWLRQQERAQLPEPLPSSVAVASPAPRTTPKATASPKSSSAASMPTTPKPTPPPAVLATHPAPATATRPQPTPKETAPPKSSPVALIPTTPKPTPPPAARPAPLAQAAPSAQPATATTARVPEPRPAPTAAAERNGSLRIGVTPYADVVIDGVVVGTTPMGAVPLSPGRHTVRLIHPDYQPLQRVVTVRAGETTPLTVDLPLDGVRK